MDAVNSLGERNTNVMALLAWLGFEQTTIPYRKDARKAGTSGWTFRKKLKLLFDRFTASACVRSRHFRCWDFW